MVTANKNPYAPAFEDLPESIPIFPLTGVLLLPHGTLPLNIFEPRYVAMFEYAMKTHRMIGMMQPKSPDNEGRGEVYTTGCAGKITEFSETPEGTFQISLSGICRFEVREELDNGFEYREIKANWEPFKTDIETKTCLGVDRKRLTNLLREYFEREGMSCDFDKFEDVQDGKLMTCLSMVCPFEPSEKQALLEEVCCKERAQMFMTMVEMAVKSGKTLDKSKTQCH